MLTDLIQKSGVDLSATVMGTKVDPIAVAKGAIIGLNTLGELGTILATGNVICELPDYSISNIVNDTKTLKDISSQHKMIILEISWLTCKDCIEQDNNFTEAIYSKYSTEQIYRYYLKSKKDEVIANRK